MLRYRSIDLWPYTGTAHFAGYDNIDHICANLRAFDAAETAALLGDQRPLLAAHFKELALSAYDCRIVMAGDREPIALVGVWPCWPGVGSAQMVATDRFPEIAGDLSRWIRRELIPDLLRRGVRRVEARAMKAATENCRWLEVLGAHAEGECKMLGRDGETYIQYAWTKGDGLCA